MLQRLLAGLLIVLACTGSEAAQSPRGLDVSLLPKAGKTTFTLGEPIELELLLSARLPGFSVSELRGTVPDQIEVSPAKGWFRAHGIDEDHDGIIRRLEAKPVHRTVLLNNAIAFQAPGRYTISVQTHVFGPPGSPALGVKTNSVTIQITAPDDTAEAARVPTLVTQIKAQAQYEPSTRTAPQLAFLTGDAAVRAKVDCIVNRADDCENARRQMLFGLASSRNLKLQLALLHEAWSDPAVAPSFDLFKALQNTRAAMRGETVDGWQFSAAPRTDAAAHRAANEDQLDLQEMIDSLPSRSARNRAEAARQLMAMGVLTEAQAAQLRPYTEPTPPGLDVSLRPKGGKTRFTLGEPIVLDLAVGAHVPGFQVNVLEGGVVDQIDVSPAEGWLRAHGVDYHDVVMYRPLTEEPIHREVRLHRAIAFQKPGHYEITVTTGIERTGAPSNWLEVSSNAVSIEIIAPDEAAEALRVGQLVARINEGTCGQRVSKAAAELALLGGDAAVRAKVNYIVNRDARCDGVDQQMLGGLASARHLPLQLTLLRQAWLDVSAAPPYNVFQGLHNTRGYLRGQGVEGWRMIRAPRKDPAVDIAAREDARDIQDLLDSLPARQGASRWDTAYLLAQLDDVHERQLAQLRPLVVQNFGQFSPSQQGMLLEGRRWRRFADPALVPVLQAALERTGADGIDRGQALQRLIQLAPLTARPLVVREICNAKASLALRQVDHLPDARLPEIDDCLTVQLAQWRGEALQRVVRSELLARYGSAGALPAVRELYAQRPQDEASFASPYAGALLGYLVRYAPIEAVQRLQVYPDNKLTAVLPGIAQVFGASQEAYPPVFSAWLQRLAADGTPDQKLAAQGALAPFYRMDD